MARRKCAGLQQPVRTCLSFRTFGLGQPRAAAPDRHGMPWHGMRPTCVSTPALQTIVGIARPRITMLVWLCEVLSSRPAATKCVSIAVSFLDQFWPGCVQSKSTYQQIIELVGLKFALLWCWVARFSGRNARTFAGARLPETPATISGIKNSAES